MKLMAVFALALVVAATSGCKDKGKRQPPQGPAAGSAAVDPEMLQAREEFIADIGAFSGMKRDDILYRITKNTGIADEWREWEAKGPMTEDRIKQFYKQTKFYSFDLASWHLWLADKWQSDKQLLVDLKSSGVKNVLDFGGGTGFNAFILARGGLDVTLADLDSVTLDFARFRAERHGVKLKYWKSDVEPMPPDKKYDAILCLDVLEHLPEKELQTTVDKLIQLKHAGTRLVIHAPFGRTSVHPMHLDLTPETQHQIDRLQRELPQQ